MSLSKYSKRRGQFEALEAKQLFAADLVGGAAADLPDTAVVAENVQTNIGGIGAGGDRVAENARIIMGGIKTSEESFVRCAPPDLPQLGGQEGEPLMNTNLSDHLIVYGETLYQRSELDLAPNLGGQEGELIIDTDSSNQWLGQLHHIKPHGSAGSYSDYPEITDQHMGETAISKRDQAYSIVGFQDTDLHLPHVDYQSLGGQEGEDFTAEGVTGDSATIAAVDSIFSMGAIRTPMTADTGGIGAVNVSGIAAVDTCGLAQGALRLI